MTIVGIAHVSGITTISREDTHPIARPVEVHPAWCICADDDNAMCGDHLGKTTDIPATAGGFTVIDSGCLFPRFAVAATTQDGALGVNVVVFDPSDHNHEWVEVNLEPATAREFAAALEASRTTRVDGMNGTSAWIGAAAGEPVTVCLIDQKRKALVSARLHAHEVKALADAITSAADVVDGRTQSASRVA